MLAHDVHEGAADRFAPGTLLPTQYFDRIRRRKDFTGEQRLMIAVLELAVDDYLQHAAIMHRRAQGLFAGAEEWIESPDRSWVYAFETICDHFGLDADYVRKGLRRRKARARGNVAPAVHAADVDVSPERRRASNE